MVNMSNYYAEKLNSKSLFQVYATKIPRIRQYLDEEIGYVRRRLTGKEKVLEIAAGYGRIVRRLAPYCAAIVGMDISEENVELAQDYLKDCPNASMVCMDARHIRFDEKFDAVICLQNGLSAIRAKEAEIDAIIDLLAPGGAAYFSTYSARFWDWRIKWFEEQTEKKLLGELDYGKTKDGVIVCKDGFRATTQTPEDYESIGRRAGLPYEIAEVDGSSLFLIVHNNKRQT